MALAQGEVTHSVTAATTGDTSARIVHVAALVALLVVALAIPFVASSYRLLQFTMVVIYSIALLGLNILTGFNGQISLGHGAFYAIGAYTTAILLERTGIPYWGAIPISGAVCLVAGFLFGTAGPAAGRPLPGAVDLCTRGCYPAIAEVPRA
jgi:ABC-type branched-subunit amino acid transport system permease subunit